MPEEKEKSVEENLWSDDPDDGDIEPYGYAGVKPDGKPKPDPEPDGGDPEPEEDSEEPEGDDEGDGDEDGESPEEDQDAEEPEEVEEEKKEDEERVFTLKVDGENIEKSEDEMISLAQKGLHAQKTLAEARQLEEDIQWVKDEIINDPLKVAVQMIEARGGHTAEQIDAAVYNYLARTYEQYDKLINAPEAERQALQARRELERTQRENEELRRIQEARSREEKIRAEQERFSVEVGEAMESVGLPDNDDARILMIEAILAREDDPGSKELTIQEIANIVKGEYEERVANRVQGLTLEDLEKYPELLKKLRKADVEALKQRSTPQKAQGTSRKKKPATSRRRRRKADSPKDFRTLLEETAT